MGIEMRQKGRQMGTELNTITKDTVKNAAGLFSNTISRKKTLTPPIKGSNPMHKGGTRRRRNKMGGRRRTRSRK